MGTIGQCQKTINAILGDLAAGDRESKIGRENVGAADATVGVYLASNLREATERFREWAGERQEPWMRIAFVLGTRPEIMKLCPVIKETRKRQVDSLVIHSGQHYDPALSDVFFHDLGLPDPDLYLEVGSGSHAEQTGLLLQRLEEVFCREPSDLVMVEGDTNTALSGALVAIKLRIPVAHLEAGVRSFDMQMPEEVNRRLVDSVATLCLAPTPRAVSILRREGREQAAHLVGDTLVEVALAMACKAACPADLEARLELKTKGYALVTMHRSENVDNSKRLSAIVEALLSIDFPVVYPVHPRARKMLQSFGLLDRLGQKARLLEPVGYQDFLGLLVNARLVLTDSGGVQQEASIFNIPCLTLRNNTEWVETLEAGKNILWATRPEGSLRTSNGS